MVSPSSSHCFIIVGSAMGRASGNSDPQKRALIISRSTIASGTCPDCNNATKIRLDVCNEGVSLFTTCVFIVN